MKTFKLSALLLLSAVMNLSAQNFSEKAVEAKQIAVSKKMNTHFAILVDMSIHSGKKRLVVWDFQGDSIWTSSLCSHGNCGGGKSAPYSSDTAIFSNESGSLCSAEGTYRVGARAYSNWGINIHYKLHGLEPSNSNAFNRIIVLHSYDQVPEEEIYPRRLVNSWGCPMVSDEQMKKLDQLLKQEKNVLLWIYK